MSTHVKINWVLSLVQFHSETNNASSDLTENSIFWTVEYNAFEFSVLNIFLLLHHVFHLFWWGQGSRGEETWELPVAYWSQESGELTEWLKTTTGLIAKMQLLRTLPVHTNVRDQFFSCQKPITHPTAIFKLSAWGEEESLKTWVNHGRGKQNKQKNGREVLFGVLGWTITVWAKLFLNISKYITISMLVFILCAVPRIRYNFTEIKSNQKFSIL